MRLEGKKILLTGGRGGLGTALYEVLVQKGAHVTSLGRSQEDDIRADLSSGEDVLRVCRRIESMPVDMLINNAALQHFGRTHEQPEARLMAMVAVNLQAPLLLTRAVLPGMLAQKQGQIVNIGSALAGVPFPHFSVYCATKGGMRAFSQSIRREYRGRGITVTYAAPRAMRTAMSAGPVSELLKRTRSAMDLPSDTAEKIVRAIESDRPEISIGLSERFFSGLNMLAPALIDSGLKGARDIGEDILSTVQT